jgi:RES domain-containing protein
MSGITLWRIASDAPAYSSDSLGGEGAKSTGGRWNRKGTPLVYLSPSISLACLETLVHLSGGATLPLNRYLIRVEVPEDLWERRAVFDRDANVGWDAEPAGIVSRDWGTNWAQSNAGLLADVPSVVVIEERNVLLNPAHPDCRLVSAKKIRKWIYDVRLNNRPAAPIAATATVAATGTRRLAPRRKK